MKYNFSFIFPLIFSASKQKTKKKKKKQETHFDGWISTAIEDLTSFNNFDRNRHCFYKNRNLLCFFFYRFFENFLGVSVTFWGFLSRESDNEVKRKMKMKTIEWECEWKWKWKWNIYRWLHTWLLVRGGESPLVMGKGKMNQRLRWVCV